MSPSAQPTSSATPIIAPVAVPAALIQDGEQIVLAIKPSLVFILLVSLPTILGLAVVMGVAYMLYSTFPGIPMTTVTEICAAGVLLRVVVAAMQWLARLYVLTDRRVIRVKGVLNVDIFECPLTRIQNTYLSLTLSERIFVLGTIYFATAGTAGMAAAWLMIARPREVHEIVITWVHRAQRGANHSDGTR